MKQIQVNLGGKLRTLKFDFNALCMAETLGVNIGDLQNGSTPMNALRTLLYVGLCHEDKKLTVISVGEMIDKTNLKDITAKLQEALTDAFGEEEEIKNVPFAQKKK
jgi:hypothetical protein